MAEIFAGNKDIEYGVRVRNQISPDPTYLKIITIDDKDKQDIYDTHLYAETVEEVKKALGNPSCKICGKDIGLEDEMYTSASYMLKIKKEPTICGECKQTQDIAKKL